MTILSLASLSTGFVLGWVVGRPRRWYSGTWTDAAAPGDDLPPLRRVRTGT
ncbi:hypothetical protein [Actinomadura alba]|uniref:Uncharacterized protein n=1 Tax=Actinomadura alba TaxID=406431 RepID=A0ABR7LM59_9ACTN|nr:hypothetical protein [Actinomadura alba]MBC6465580.1 hypothetical protein [Actinomadura alba]